MVIMYRILLKPAKIKNPNDSGSRPKLCGDGNGNGDGSGPGNGGICVGWVGYD